MAYFVRLDNLKNLSVLDPDRDRAFIHHAVAYMVYLQLLER